jgi:crotonobetainyl-CoA:carnitine CoA-transferase CaiB-like acyl-CoA transferase
MNGSHAPEPLLAGLRVIDMADQKLETVGRLLADMGADVIRIEPPGGASSRQRPPIAHGVSLYFAAHNANKRGITLDIASSEGQEMLWRLLGSADMWIESTAPGTLDAYGLAPASVLSRLPSLVVVSVTDFGQDGPYHDFVATEPVELALGGQLSRSGLAGREPLLLPAGMCHETTAAQAAWAALLAYYRRLATGFGDHVDFSIFEATVQTLDPVVGTIGTAAMSIPSWAGLSKWVTSNFDRGRPSVAPYPIFSCNDGYVRVAVLTEGQWLKMRAWLGEPAQFQDAKFGQLIVRYEYQDEIHALYREFFADKSKFDVADESQRRGIPIVAVMTPAEVLREPHIDARGVFCRGQIAPGVWASFPSGFFEVDGDRVGYRDRAPEPGEHNDEILSELTMRERLSFGLAPRSSAPASTPPRAMQPGSDRPLHGIRVLDFGAIVFGAEVGRLLGDMGAEIIKVENREFVDASRRSPEAGIKVTAKYAVGQRNKKSFGVDLRSPEGVALIKRLAKQSDVVLSNFKPGTLEKLGLGWEVLHQINPGLVWMSASGFGHTGPWSSWSGYGPLVRSVSGLTSLWRYPDDPTGFADQVTIYPDHFGGRVAALAVVAGLVRRQRCGLGADLRVSQTELVINSLAEYYLQESLTDVGADAANTTSQQGSPWNVYRCAGDDEWCVITIRDDAEWRQFGQAIGSPEWTRCERYSSAAGRIAYRSALDAHVTDWTSGKHPHEVTHILQRAGVPAGHMNRGTDLEQDEHLVSRQFFAGLPQPGFASPLPTESRSFHSRNIPVPPLQPAPELGEHSEWVCAEILGMNNSDIVDLIAAGVLQVPMPV